MVIGCLSSYRCLLLFWWSFALVAESLDGNQNLGKPKMRRVLRDTGQEIAKDALHKRPHSMLISGKGEVDDIEPLRPTAWMRTSENTAWELETDHYCSAGWSTHWAAHTNERLESCKQKCESSSSCVAITVGTNKFGTNNCVLCSSTQVTPFTAAKWDTYIKAATPQSQPGDTTPKDQAFESVGHGWCLDPTGSRIEFEKTGDWRKAAAMWTETAVAEDGSAMLCETQCISQPLCIGYMTEDKKSCHVLLHTDLNGASGISSVDTSTRNYCWKKPVATSTTGTQAYEWIDLTSATATQSSTWKNIGVASRAIDGNANSQWSGSSCTHTNGESSPWWEVDLGSSQTIKAVELTNRGDCCADRLDGVSVYVGGVVCNSSVPIALGETKTVDCNGVGSIVRLQMPQFTTLTICELRVAIQAPTAAVAPTQATAAAAPEVCPQKVIVAGAEDVQPAKMGSYVKSSITTGSTHSSKPIYENAKGMSIYFWAAVGNWIISGSGSEGDRGTLYAKDEVNCDSNCPTSAARWAVWTGSEWSHARSITVIENP